MKGLKAKWNGASQLMRRTIVITVVMAVLAVCCLGKLVYIQLIEGPQLAMAAQQSRTLKVTLQAKRGKIMDTNGVVLAQSVERYTIIGNPDAAQTFEPTACTAATKPYCQQLDGKPLTTTGVISRGKETHMHRGMARWEAAMPPLIWFPDKQEAI